MKALSNKHHRGGFSIIEIVIAMALLLIVVTGALSSQLMSEYWAISSQLSAEALSLVARNENIVRTNARQNFYTVSSTVPTDVVDPTDPILQSCREGGLCYVKTHTVTDTSQCAKSIDVTVTWKAGERYATSSIVRTVQLSDVNELTQRGGDCPLDLFSDTWSTITPVRKAVLTNQPIFSTGIDVLGDRVYLVASSSPQLRVYSRPVNLITNPQLLASSSILSNRLNAIDVVRDIASGRTYAYVVQHTKTSQLVVVDVTNDEINVVTARSLVGTDALGSFPQGWRVVAYGKRLYVTARETAGAELHIFSVADPTNPIEISTGAINLARTVNDMEVYEFLVGSTMRRYLFLAASAALKEFAIFEVTNDIPIERIALDLPGTENALSVYLNGDDVFIGREQSPSGPELYHYQISKLLVGDSLPSARSEVGANVHTIQGNGRLLFLGTNKANAELQVWWSQAEKWNASVVNAARISSAVATRLVPLGIDWGGTALYTIAQSVTQPEQLSIWSTP